MKVDSKMLAKLPELFAEFLGTFILVSIIFLSGILTRGFEPFLIGFGLFVLIFTFSKYTLAHFNPIVTLAFLVTKRITPKRAIMYIVVQFLAVVVAFPVVFWIREQYIDFQIVLNNAQAIAGYRDQIAGQIPLVNGYNEEATSLAFVFEALFSFIFVTVILFVTSNEKSKNAAGFIIGTMLFGITALAGQISGASFHPFRSLVPALFEMEEPIRQVWLYLLAPTAGSLLAAILYWIFKFMENPASLRIVDKSNAKTNTTKTEKSNSEAKKDGQEKKEKNDKK